MKKTEDQEDHPYHSLSTTNGNFARRIKGRSYRLHVPHGDHADANANDNDAADGNFCVVGKSRCSSSMMTNGNGNNSSSSALAKRVQMISKSAALASKKKLWDTNDAVDNAAQSAVDVWESSYHTTRQMLIQSYTSLRNIYNATKDGVQKIEHHLLVPVRDVVILPAFSGVERAVDATHHFLQSDEAAGIAHHSYEIIRHTPLVGERVLAPVIMHTIHIIQQTYDVVKYPIPSRQNVRNTVDGIMEGTKHMIALSWREMYFYTKLVDASITRALSHTQWRVLGSGPYSSLNEEHKAEVIDHLCERYFSTPSVIARYELSCHIQYQNYQLYQDLVASGLLLERGGEFAKNDTWLSENPDYMCTSIEEKILLIGRKEKGLSGQDEEEEEEEKKRAENDQVAPLWFYLPNKSNGERPDDVRWICFNEQDSSLIEDGFLSYRQDLDGSSFMTPEVSGREADNDRCKSNARDKNCDESSAFPTIAKWYDTHPAQDVLIDQKRHAISYLPCCQVSRLQNKIDAVGMDGKATRSSHSHVCSDCRDGKVNFKNPRIDKLRVPMNVMMRPTLWRFYGPGNTVRRGVWLMDTQRYGLQPYSDESASILEEAYLFLKWKKFHNNTDPTGRGGIDSVLLTVQVEGPDGEETQLVQFRSLTQITAIQKSVTGGLALFKRRVYRGAEQHKNNNEAGHNRHEDDTQISIAASYDLVQSSIKRYPQIPTTESDEADHLVLVVHGIGEMLRNSDLFGMPLPGLSQSLIDCCSSLRKNHSDILNAYQCLSENEAFKGNHEYGRVEFLPVEWHESFSIASRGYDRDGFEGGAASLADISLDTIPHLRNFANDTMLDILFFMSPRHHDIMIELVTHELNDVVKRYKTLTGFKGKISILSHSLGSVVAWDILSHQVPDTEDINSRSTKGDLDEIIHSEPTSSELKAKSIYPQLNFEVTNSFMIGSPLAVFLMLRNEQLSEDYYLPGCRKVFNIFHPHDPVAYRIEPMIHRSNATAEPMIITNWKGGFRMQYQTKFLWRKIINETKKTQKNVVKAVEAGIEGMGLLDESIGHLMSEEEDALSTLSDESNYQFVHVGKLCQGRRLDYMLQEKELENANEYISALAAHSSYWGEKDLITFISKEIFVMEKNRQGGSACTKEKWTEIQAPNIASS